jgi:hypothetical protein
VTLVPAARRTLQSRYMCRVAVTLCAALGLSLLPIAPGASSSASAASSDIVAVVVDGTGFGHGRGMSQWGAYGWAVDQGKSWEWILDHYYGGTTLGDVNTSQSRIRVRLLGLDNLATVGVTAGAGSVSAGGVTARSLFVTETSANRFDIYSSTSMACPASTTLVVPNGPIARGSSDSTAVRQIQTFLNTFRISGDTILAVDGAFGPMTEMRLKDWQSDQNRLSGQNLVIDGVWNSDDATRARQLISTASGTASWTLERTVTGPVVFTSPSGENSAAVPSSVLGVCDPGGRITHYRGSIEVRSESVGNRVVNDVKTEDYLRGVVPKEISPSWADAGGGAGINAVRAQAVAARSYGLQQNRYGYASICDSQSCQVYFGSASRASVSATPIIVEDLRTDAAIAATAGKVRKFPSGAVASTEFSASNGPRTAGGVFAPVDDVSGDGTSRNPNHRWTRVLDADALAVKYGLGRLTSATMVEAASSTNRQFDGIWFNDVVLTGSNGQRVQIPAWDFRSQNGLLSPGFTLRTVTRDTRPQSVALIGDSIGNSIAGSASSPLRTLTNGTFSSLRVDVVDGRCTITQSCPGTSGVQAAAALPFGLDLVVVQLGYNDWGSGDLSSAIDPMMQALLARGVKQVAWVNLAQHMTGSTHASKNAALAAATSRWPNLTVLDWNAASNTSERVRWFTSDGIHLTLTGRAEFALWLRQQMTTIAPPPPAGQRLAPPKRIELAVAGESVVTSNGSVVTIPADVTAVTMNVVAVSPSRGGYITVWPCSRPRPRTSNLNYDRGSIDGNGVIAPVDASGRVCLYSLESTDLVIDVTGWFGAAASPSSAFTAITPHRVADSRIGSGVPLGRVGQAPTAIQVVGRAVMDTDGRSLTVPDNVVAVAINVVSAAAASDGFISAWPCGVDRPRVSNLNYTAREIRGNGAIVAVGAGGAICVSSSASTDVVADLVGWFTADDPAASAFVSPVPQRIVDTRTGLGAPAGRVQPSRPIAVDVAGVRATVGGAPQTIGDAEAVALNVAVQAPQAAGFLTVWPCGSPRPNASSLNFRAGQTISNNVIATVGSGGAICVHTTAPTDVIIDVAGWFKPGGSFRGLVPGRFLDTRYGIGPSPI